MKSESGRSRLSLLNLVALVGYFSIIGVAFLAHSQMVGSTGKTPAEVIQEGDPQAVVLTNTAQLAEFFQNAEFPLSAWPYSPEGGFYPTTILWGDFSALPKEFSQLREAANATDHGIPVWPLWLTLWPQQDVAGEITLRAAWSDAVLWAMPVPPGFDAQAVFDQVFYDYYTIFGITNSYPVATTEWWHLGPEPHVTMHAWLASVDDAPEWLANIIAEVAEMQAAELELASKVANQSLTLESFGGGGGGMMLLLGGGCTISSETNEFTVTDIQADSNGFVTVTWESCPDHLYQPETSEELTTQTVWTVQATVIGEDGYTSWTDTNAPAFENRFYRVLRLDATIGDFDNDFWADWAEFAAGTSPTNAASFPPFSFGVNGGVDVVSGTQLQIGLVTGIVAQSVIISEDITFVPCLTNSFAQDFTYTLVNTNDGLHSIYLRLLNGGGTSSATFARTVQLDTKPPTLTITAPTNGTVTALRRLNVTGFAADTADLSSQADPSKPLQVAVNGGFINDRETNGVWWSGLHDLSPGTNMFVIIAADRAGFAVTNSAWLVYAPALATNVPVFTVDLTNAVTVASNTTTIAVSGGIDDDNAIVQIDIVDAVDHTITNASISAAVRGTNWWAEVPVLAGSNLVVFSARNTGSAAVTNSFLTIQNTNAWLEITSPVANAAANATSILVVGKASTNFNGAITINGQAALTSVSGGVITFSNSVSLTSVDANVIEVQATGTDGSTATLRQLVYGYEVVAFQHTWPFHWQHVRADCWFSVHYPNDHRDHGDGDELTTWTAPDAEVVWTAYDNTYGSSGNLIEHDEYYDTWPWDSNYLPTADTGEVQFHEYRDAKHVEAGVLPPPIFFDCNSTEDDCEEEEISGCCVNTIHEVLDVETPTHATTFIKHWPTDEEQTVILHFKNFYYYDRETDVTKIALWGQPGFIYEILEEPWGLQTNVGFLVKIKTNARYTLRETSFTWPIVDEYFTARTPNAQSLYDVQEIWHQFYYDSFANEPVKIEFVREQPVGSGSFTDVTEAGVPVFQPDDGVGRGAAPVPENIIGLNLALQANLTNSLPDTMNVTCSTALGTFAGQLMETGAASGVFTNADGAFTLVLDPVVETTDEIVETLHVSVTSGNLGLTNAPFSVLEVEAAAREFANVIVDTVVTFDAPLDTNAVDTIHIQLNSNFDPYIYDDVAVETGPDTRVFTNALGGVTLTVNQITGFDSGTVDFLDVTIANEFLTETNAVLSLSETATDSLEFSNLADAPDVNMTPKDPNTTDEGVFYVEVLGTEADPDVINLKISTDIDEVAVPATKISDRTWRTDKLLLVPEGTTEIYGDITPVQIGEGELRAERADIDGIEVEAKAKRAAFVGVAYKSLGPAFPSVKNNGKDIEERLTENLGWTVVRDESMTKTEVLTALPKHSLWYSFNHGVALGNNFKHFYAFKKTFFGMRYSWEKIIPQDVAAANADNEYQLVFINGCNSADQDAASLVQDFIDAFHAKSWVGWEFQVNHPVATAASKTFFDALDGGAAVQKAVDAVRNSGIDNADRFLPRKGGDATIDLTP